MKIAHERRGNVAVLSLSGRLDSTAAVSAEAGFAIALSGASPRIAIDLSGLEYISSAGLRALLVLAKQVQQADGKVVLCGLSEAVAEVFSVSGFDTIFPILPDRAAGIAAVQ